MRTLVIGDLHFDNTKNYVANSNSFNEVLQTLFWIKDKVKELKPDITVFLGDIFDNPSTITTSVISIVSEYFNNLSNLSLLVILSGNHDILENNDTNIKINDEILNYKGNLLSIFKGNKRIAVLEKIKTFEIDKETDYIFIPFTDNIPNKLIEHLQKDKIGNKKIIFGHFDIADAPYMQLEAKNGNINLNNYVNLDLIKHLKIHKVYLGHVHDKYNIENVEFLGACRNINFNNKQPSKGIYLFDSDKDGYEYFENPYSPIYVTLNSFDELLKYIEEHDKLELLKTNVKLKFSTNDEVTKTIKYKSNFKSVSFSKSNNFLDDTNTDVPTTEHFSNEMKKLLDDNVIDINKIIDLIISFKNKDVFDKDKEKDFIKMVNTWNFKNKEKNKKKK